MKKMFFLTTMVVCCVMFVSAQGLQMLWNKSNYSWNTGGANRDATVYKGKFYLPVNGGTTVRVLEGADGSELTSISSLHSSFSLAVDNAGNLIVPKNGGGSQSWNLQYVNLGTGVITPVTGWPVGQNIPIRADNIDIRGNITSGTAYVVGVGSAGQIQVWEIVNGAVSDQNPKFTATKSEAGGTGADIRWIDDKRFLTTGQSRTPTIMTVNFSASPFITKVEPINIGTGPLATIDCGGGVVFELAGIPYLVRPDGGTIANGVRAGVISIHDITNLNSPKKIGGNTAPTILGTGANTMIRVAIYAEKIADNEAIVYVWACDHGAAAYKVEAVKTPVLSPASGEYDIEEGQTLEVTLDCDTEDAEISYSIESSNPSAAPLRADVVYDGTPLQLPAGSHTITMKATKAGLFDNISKATYDITAVVAAGAVIADNIRVVAANGQISITSNNPIQSVKLIDLQGRIIASKKVSAKNCTLAAPAKGVYIVETFTGGLRNVQKVSVR